MPLKKGDIKVGDKVVFVGPDRQDCHPPIGTVGIFIRDDGTDCPEFAWPEGSLLNMPGQKYLKYEKDPSMVTAYCSYHRLERYKKKTQADKIIAEGAKGLAKLFAMACPPGASCTDRDIKCDACIMNWLLSEVDE